MNDPSEITPIILKAAEKARKETGGEAEPELTREIEWPTECTVGPGLEGAIACESRIGYVNGSKGRLIYQGYDIFDLAAYSTFEEVSYLLMHGALPTRDELDDFKDKLTQYRHIPKTLRIMMGFPVEDMNAMAALRLGANMLRREFTSVDQLDAKRDIASAISADEDSIPMETRPMGEPHAIYEFKRRGRRRRRRAAAVDVLDDAANVESCYHLIAGVPTVAAAIARIHQGLLPIVPDPNLGHAANYLYMMTGRIPSPVEQRIMDICLILHADHGMNASTFAAMVVASTLSDFYLSIGSGIAALNGPLHGGANEEVLHVLNEIGDAKNVKNWYKKARAKKRKIMGFGHRVYKAYDPRARVLAPLAQHLAKKSKDARRLLGIARALEKEVVASLGKRKGIYPNVDFYSGMVYSCLGVPAYMFTPTFAVARVSGWSARIMEYLKNNRIFRPRAMYVGDLDRKYTPIRGRRKPKR